MPSISDPLNEHQAHYFVNNYVKLYNKHMELFVYKNPFKKRHENLEPRTKDSHEAITPKIKTAEQDEINKERSLRRTRTVIADIVKMNDFNLFGTFTFDQKKIDRYNISKCKKALSVWLSNQQRITGGFEYLIIPEFHKDGALHFHAILQGYPSVKLKDSGRKDNAKRPIYNIRPYTLGYTNFSYIGSRERTASYVRKYITKDMPQISGKRRYWHSTGLKTPQIRTNVDAKLLTNGKKPDWSTDLFDKYEMETDDNTKKTMFGRYNSNF